MKISREFISNYRNEKNEIRQDSVLTKADVYFEMAIWTIDRMTFGIYERSWSLIHIVIIDLLMAIKHGNQNAEQELKIFVNDIKNIKLRIYIAYIYAMNGEKERAQALLSDCFQHYGASADAFPSLPNDDITISTGKKIGFGTYGEIYLGKIGPLDCVIKKNHKDFHQERFYVFATEVFFLHQLRGQRHIVQLQGFSFGDDVDGLPLIALEYAKYGDLLRVVSKLRKEDKTFAIYDQLSFAKQLISGILTMHQLNIIHRDLMPCNILFFLDETGKFVIKIADLGAAATKEMIQLELNNRRTALTTFQYASLDGALTAVNLAESDEDIVAIQDVIKRFCITYHYSVDKMPYYSEKSDIASFGAILYFLAKFAHPFINLGKESPELPIQTQIKIANHLLDNGVPKFEGQCCPRYYDLVKRSRALDPKDRPTAAEALQEINTCLAEVTEASAEDNRDSPIFSAF